MMLQLTVASLLQMNYPANNVRSFLFGSYRCATAPDFKWKFQYDLAFIALTQS